MSIGNMITKGLGIVTAGAAVATGGGWAPLAIAGGLAFAGGSAGAWWIQGYRVEAAQTERDLARDDATRWHAASDLRDKSIIWLNGEMERSDAEARALLADQKTRAAKAEAALRARRTGTETDISKVRSDIDARSKSGTAPAGDASDLDPVVRGALERDRLRP